MQQAQVIQTHIQHMIAVEIEIVFVLLFCIRFLIDSANVKL
jgi:hypothetical protein